ncbi:MAG: class I SAM-dependent methyltransferase [Alistipes sp.]|nr:class I SAM-dependent methyltransferase [Alistipes sp.]
MDNPALLTPRNWEEYELIDSGGFEKLERFGSVVTVRPEPQALWRKALPEEEWERTANAFFRRGASEGAPSGKRAQADERGTWDLRPGVPGQWKIDYAYKDMSLRMRLGFTAFKHVGLFPEQAENWDFIYDSIGRIRSGADGRPAVLNLFAYTGGATLAAALAGAAVTHVDSVKQVVGWARENATGSGLDQIRWIVDDAAKFVAREVRRGNRYRGIILDPPAYGRGPDGEKWVLEQHLPALLDHCARLLEPSGSFLILNLYSMGLSSLLARSTVKDTFRPGQFAPSDEKYGELYFSDRAGRQLPLGVFYRAFFGR